MPIHSMFILKCQPDSTLQKQTYVISNMLCNMFMTAYIYKYKNYVKVEGALKKILEMKHQNKIYSTQVTIKHKQSMSEIKAGQQ